MYGTTNAFAREKYHYKQDKEKEKEKEENADENLQQEEKSLCRYQ